MRAAPPAAVQVGLVVTLPAKLPSPAVTSMKNNSR